MAASKAITISDQVVRRRDINRSRYERHVLEGVPVEDIAKEDRVTVSTVNASIERIRRYREMCTLQELESSQIEVIQSVSSKERKALTEMLEANLTYEVLDAKGNKIKVVAPDHTVRAKGIDLINKKIEAIKPNGKGSTFQVGVVAGGNGAQEETTVTVAQDGGGDFEGILRRVRQTRRAQMAEAENLALPEGRIIEAEPVESSEPRADSSTKA